MFPLLVQRVSRLFGLSLVRSRALVRAAVFYFSFVAGVTALKSATNALFLVRRDPTDLPYLYLATALAITLVTADIGKRLATYGAKPILRLAITVSVIALSGLGVLAAIDFRPALGVLYVAGEVYATAISVLFWARLGEVFDVRSAKRVFGTIGAAGMAGAVLGGLGVRWLAGTVPSVVWCFFAVLTLALMHPLIGRDRGKTVIHHRKISFGDGISYAILERFPRGVALLVLLISIQTSAVDYVFRTGAFAFENGDEAALAGMFGVLNAVVGVGSILVQASLTAWLLGRVGVFVFLSIIPVACIAAAGWAFLFPTAFAPLFLLKTFEMMGSLSLNQPALQLLYNPMPASVRDSVRALVDGAVKKLGGAAGGVILIFVGSFLAEREQLGVVICLALVIMLWIRSLRGSYLQALEAKLGARGGATIPHLDPSDRATRLQLEKALSNEDPGKVLAAISVLAQDKTYDFRPHVEKLIAHPVESVRLKAIELVAARPDPAYAPLLVAVIQRDAHEPKAQAAAALELVDPEAARITLEPIVEAPPGTHELALVCAAIAALLPGQPGRSRPTPAEVALEGLLKRGRQGTARERREIAKLLGLLGPGAHARQLALYLDDPEHSVRLEAIQAAGKARDASLPERLIPKLVDRHAQKAVRAAIAAYGDDVVPTLAAVLDDRRLLVGLRVHVPRVLRQIGTTKAVEAMLFSNVQDDAFLRYVIVEELVRMRRTIPGLVFERRRTEEAALRRFRAYAHYRPIAKDLATGPTEFNLLRRSVEDRVRQNLEAALRLLGILHDQRMMENALAGLMREEGTSRADALELVDVTLQGSDIRGQVLAFLEAAHAPPPRSESRAGRRGMPSRAVDRAYGLVEGRDMQLALIAWESLRRIGEDPPEVHEPSTGEPMIPKEIIDRVFLLEGVQLFHGLSVDDLAAVAALTTEGHAEPRQVIYREGDPGSSMYIIISGEVRLLRGDQTLMDLTQGDSFGQVSILDQGPRPVTARAGDEGVDYLQLERGPFMDLVTDRPAVTSGLFIVLARRLRELVELTGAEHAGGRAAVKEPAIAKSAFPPGPPTDLRGTASPE
ncbi:cyclic nucleotide-binding domain-containing protein [Myxococcota bacterium]|nr:cyclic nucleotide-binding domain-containing protein [Myxococcota bacterium]